MSERRYMRAAREVKTGFTPTLLSILDGRDGAFNLHTGFIFVEGCYTESTNHIQVKIKLFADSPDVLHSFEFVSDDLNMDAREIAFNWVQEQMAKYITKILEVK